MKFFSAVSVVLMAGVLQAGASVCAAAAPSPVSAVPPAAMALHFQALILLPHPAAMDTLSVGFCAELRQESTDYVGGQPHKHVDTRCAPPANALHLAGRRQPTGISLDPPLAGSWRWDTDYRVVFTPEQPWAPGQNYTVKFDPTIFPDPVRLLDTEMHVDSAALTAKISDMRYVQDPVNIDKRGVTTRIDFNMKIDPAALKTHLEYRLLDGDGKAVTHQLPFTVKLDEAGTQANIATPIGALADQPRWLSVTLLPGLIAQAGEQKLAPLATQNVQIPSLFDYAKIDKIDLRIIKNSQSVPEQILIVHSNVPVSDDMLAKNLSIHLLPQDKPQPDGERPIKNYDWSNRFDIDAPMLASSPAVAFTVQHGATPTENLHSIKLDTQAGRWLFVRVGKGMMEKGGFILGENADRTVQVPAYTQEVKIASDGALLALRGERKISIYSLGADRLQFDIGRVMTHDIAHLASQDHGVFASPTLGDDFGQNDITEQFSEDRALPAGDLRHPQFSVFDIDPYLRKNPEDKGWIFPDPPNGKGLFFLKVTAFAKDKAGKEKQIASDDRFVLVSDLGLIVKTGADGTHDVFVQSVHSGEPVSGAQVQVLGLNGLPIADLRTDGDGHVSVPNLAAFDHQQKPVAYLVRDGSDLSFMKYEAPDRALDYSQFETGGVSASSDGLRAFLFSDRDIYRPGEQVHVGIVVKQGDWQKSLAGLPLQVQISNPRGQIIEKATLALDDMGMASYDFSTRDVSPTGVYHARLTVAGKTDEQIGEVPVRVEDFQPDTLKITATFNKPSPRGWVTPDGLNADVALDHLYGAPAAGYRVHASVDVAPGKFQFKQFADYRFFNPLKTEKHIEQELGDRQTDATGHAHFDLGLGQFGQSTYQLSFNADGFPPDSGHSVQISKGILISPRAYVVGVKSTGDLGYINRGDKRALQLIVVNNDLTPIAAPGLKLKIASVTHVRSLVESENGGYRYDDVPKETEGSSSRFTIPAGGLELPLDSHAPGDYVLTLADDEGTVLQRVPYSIVGPDDANASRTTDAALTVKLDKTHYQPGDKISMNINAPYTGAGLITLEADKVVAFKWFAATDPSSIQTIDIPGDFVGKGFVNVQFLRAQESRAVFTMPLTFAVQPFFVSTDARDSHIQLTVPPQIKPGQTLDVQYRTSQKSKIIVYAVDEGILRYAHYHTPDPLGFFLNRRALGVATAQILDQLMPEYSILASLMAPGGDTSGPELARTGNPFKRKTQPPVAFWSGIQQAGPEAHAVHIPIPNYFNGSIRVMAVAVSDGATGAVAQDSIVRGDIILTPNAPLFAAPGDKFTVGIDVANHTAGSGSNAQLALHAHPSPNLQILAGQDQSITVPEGTERHATLIVKALDSPGGATLDWQASTGKATAAVNATLSVRPAAPRLTQLRSGYIPQGTRDIAQDRSLYPAFASATASISTLPLSLIPGLQDYLDRYPFGCTEQTISKAFPAVILDGQPDLGADHNLTLESVKTTMARLAELQKDNGGFGVWPESDVDDFVSVYALHYMVMAREKHLPVSDEIFTQAQSYVQSMVTNTPSSLDQARIQAYGIYVLTRSGMVTTDSLESLMHYLRANQKDEWPEDLSAIYVAASYKLMQATPQADKIIDSFILDDPGYEAAHKRYWGNGAYYNSINRYAQYLAIIADHFPERLPKLDRKILFRLSDFIGEEDYNTLSSSYAIMAFTAYGKASMQQAPQTLSISRQEAGAWHNLKLTGGRVKNASLAITPSTQRFGDRGNLGMFYQITTDGYDRALPDKALENGLEIDRQYFDPAHHPVNTVALGATIDVAITLRTHDNATLDNMALVDLLPGGFEPVPESVQQDSIQKESARKDDDTDAAKDDRTPWKPDAINLREDRLTAFGTISPDPVTFHYKIRAVSAGSFTTPPALVESMYDHAVMAHGVAGQITVTAP